MTSRPPASVGGPAERPSLDGIAGNRRSSGQGGLAALAQAPETRHRRRGDPGFPRKIVFPESADHLEDDLHRPMDVWRHEHFILIGVRQLVA